MGDTSAPPPQGFASPEEKDKFEEFKKGAEQQFTNMYEKQRDLFLESVLYAATKIHPKPDLTNELEEAENKLREAKDELQGAKTELQQANSDLQKTASDLQEAKDKLLESKNQLQEGKDQLQEAKTRIEALEEQTKTDQETIDFLRTDLAKLTKRLSYATKLLMENADIHKGQMEKLKKEHEAKHKNALDVIARQELELEEMRKREEEKENKPKSELRRSSINSVPLLDSHDHQQIANLERQIAEIQEKLDEANSEKKNRQETGHQTFLEGVDAIVKKYESELAHCRQVLGALKGNEPPKMVPEPSEVPDSCRSATLKLNLEMAQITKELAENNEKLASKTLSDEQVGAMMARNVKLVEQIICLNPELVMASDEEKRQREKKNKDSISVSTTSISSAPSSISSPTSSLTSPTSLPQCSAPTFEEIKLVKRNKPRHPQPPPQVEVFRIMPVVNPEPVAPPPLSDKEFTKKSEELRKTLEKTKNENRGLEETIAHHKSSDPDPEFVQMMEGNRIFNVEKIKQLEQELQALLATRDPPKPKPNPTDSLVAQLKDQNSKMEKRLNNAQRAVINYQNENKKVKDIENQLKNSMNENSALKAKIQQMEEEAVKNKPTKIDIANLMFDNETLVDDTDPRLLVFDRAISAQRALVHSLAQCRALQAAEAEHTPDSEPKEPISDAKPELEAKPSPPGKSLLPKQDSLDSDGWKELTVEKEEI